MSIPKIYTPYDPPPSLGTENKEESLSRQSEAAQADVNKILKRFEATGMLPIEQRSPLFIDVSNVPDYRTALDRVNLVNATFMNMPADVRAKFDNDPAILLDALADPARQAELQELGLVPKVEGVAKDATPPAPDVPAPPPPA